MSHIRIALVGNPNSGKTTLFNAFTGAHRRVGNYPGTTVERQEREVLHHRHHDHHSDDNHDHHGGHGRAAPRHSAVVTDLPGSYSLTAYTREERVTRGEITEGKPDVVVDVLNAGVLERNLYLAVQLLELGVPLALGLNMMDEARSKGLHVNAARLSELLGIPVCETVARSGEGVDALMSAAIDHALASRGKEWMPLRISYGPDLDPALEEMEARIKAANFMPQLPARWVALKYLENDHDILTLGRKESALGPALELTAQTLAEHLKATLNATPEARIADYRYGYINALLRQDVLIREEDRGEHLEFSQRLDSVLTHRLAGPLIMLAVLYATYQISISVGNIPLGWIEGFFAWLSSAITGIMPEGLLRSLLVDGIIAGVGSVLGFVPLILLMFLCVSFMEDSGYMARVAYMLDRVFRLFGLHGCSVMPYIISGGIPGGCAVPGIMATRTLRTTRERVATILTTPFMVCGAKVPVFLLLATAFFVGQEGAVLFLLTLASWFMALIVAFALRKTLLRGESTPFVMELPPYRLPTLWGLVLHTWLRVLEYAKKAGTIILAVSILVWAGITFPELPEERTEGFEAQRREIRLEAAEDMEDRIAEVDNATAEAALNHSLAGRLGAALEPVTEAAGFDRRINIALIGGFAAKEVIVSTLGIAYSLGAVDSEEPESLRESLGADPAWNKPRAVALMFFVMLYAPCLATVAVIRRETGSWAWAGFSVICSTLLAFAVAVLARQIGSALL